MRPDKLLPRVRTPRDVRFSDLLTLVETVGFTQVHQRRSHRRYLHPPSENYLNRQPNKNGKARRYRVEQFIEALAALGLVVGEEEA